MPDVVHTELSSDGFSYIYQDLIDQWTMGIKYEPVDAR